jgi:uncharacterized protein (DUF2267 family)
MKQSIDPESAARAVFQTMEHHVSPGEIRDVMQELPEDNPLSPLNPKWGNNLSAASR